MLHAYGLGNIEETCWLGLNQDQQVCDIIIITFCNIVWKSYVGWTIKLNGPYVPPPPGGILPMPGLHSDPFSQSFHYTKADLEVRG